MASRRGSGNPARIAAPKTPAWTAFERFANLNTGEQVWQNSRFMVIVAVRGDKSMQWSSIAGDHDAHLSFRRRDRRPEFSWRDMQRMKSELCGSEAEALEVFPAEERVLDGSNQRHLFVWRPGNPAAPQIGFHNGRQVADEADIAASLSDSMVAVLSGGKRSIPLSDMVKNGVQAPFEDGKDAGLGHAGVIWTKDA